MLFFNQKENKKKDKFNGEYFSTSSTLEQIQYSPDGRPKLIVSIELDLINFLKLNPFNLTDNFFDQKPLETSASESFMFLGNQELNRVQFVHHAIEIEDLKKNKLDTKVHEFEINDKIPVNFNTEKKKRSKSPINLPANDLSLKINYISNQRKVS